MLTDEQLIAEYATSSSQEAFAELFRRYEGKLTSFLWRRIRNWDDIRDCIQETFFKVHRFAGEFRHDCKFKSWLYQIAVNSHLSEIRRPRRAFERQAVDGLKLLSVHDHRPQPEIEVADQQERDNLNRLIETEIGEESSQIIRLLDIDGLTYEDAAAHLDIPIGTVRSRRNRAVRKLKNLMAA